MSSINQRIYFIFFLCAILLAASIVLVAASQPAAASTVPDACLKDDGGPAVPLPQPGAWAIILNFNHDLSATETEVCWAERSDDSAMTITYTAGLYCQIRNNTENVMVGNGDAPFDGNFHITCPRRPGAIDPTALHNSFYVHAEATFDQVEAIYPLVRHGDVAVRTRFEGPHPNGMWTAAMISRYGTQIFQDAEPVNMTSGLRHNLNSVVQQGIGAHYVNRNLVNGERNVVAFPFDYTDLLIIGGGDDPWTLHEMVIDPPIICQHGC